MRLRIGSAHLNTMKQAKVLMKGIFPVVDIPAAMAAMFISAIPTLKNRSGCAWENMMVRVELATSASKTTRSLYFFPSSTRASP